MATSRCVFCEIVAGKLGAHVVAEDDETIAFLDRSPVFKGHVLVIPKQHIDDLPALPPGLVGPLFEVVRQIATVMPAALGADGTWTANNNVISQSVPHLHVHVVPRRKGDGLRGFFWPREKYADDAEMAHFALRLASALSGHPSHSL